jgi:eukaryotic-like serine/threonine-protein kinase
MANMMILRAITGDLRGLEFAFSQPTQAVLGRSRSCTLRLPGDATVSRQHCIVELDDFGAWVQDLGSLNGTLINGENIGLGIRAPREGDDTMRQPIRHALNDGDELRICNNIFAVCLSEAPAGGNKKVGSTSDEWHMALCV